MSIRSTRRRDVSIGGANVDTLAARVDAMNTCRLPVFALARTAYGKAPNTRTARLVAMLREQRTEGAKLDPAIAANLKELGYGG
jgi:hypothetical protein